MILQLFHYNDVFFQYENRQFPFNLGMISSTSKPDVLPVENFYAVIDISQLLNDSNIGSTSLGRRKRSVSTDWSLLGNTVTITRFTVPQETLCWASVTTEFGRMTMDFRYGELVSLDEYVFVRNISTSGENVFVLYGQEVANVTFHCSCIQPGFQCGGKVD